MKRPGCAFALDDIRADVLVERDGVSVIRRVSLAKCVASSSRRVQVVLHLDVEPGAAEPIANALRRDPPEAILRGFADLAKRPSDRSGP